MITKERTITCGSLFSGVAGFDEGFRRAGIETLWQVEIDKNARGVLERHFPDVERYEDVKEVGRTNLRRTNIICGGFPCTDVSVAGARAGLVGKQSGLWFEFLRILEETVPEVVVIENVPGLLSSNKGRDFECVLQGLERIGYSCAWRILDSQYFGVAQRRRRLFIVAHSRIECAAEILFESDCMFGDSKSVEKTRDIAPTLFASGAGTSRTASSGSESQFCIPTLDGNPVAYSVREDATAKGGVGNFSATEIEVSRCLNAVQPSPQSHHAQTFIVGALQHRDYKGIGTTTIDGKIVNGELGVRRLTPTECERLQGFPKTRKMCTISMWKNSIENHPNDVFVETLSPKSQRYAGIVVKSGMNEIASYVENTSHSNEAPINRPVRVSVLINLEESRVDIHSQGKSIFSVSNAEPQSLFPLPIPFNSFVRIIALVLSIQEQIIRSGKGVSPPNTTPFITQKNGRCAVIRCGDEITRLVNDAKALTNTVNACLKFITLPAAQNSLNLERQLTTLCCCVVAVIGGFIPEVIRNTNSFDLSLEMIGNWTSGQADSTRYKQMGNAVTVSVAEWLGNRIKTVLENEKL